MDKFQFRKNEVLAFLEDLMINEEVTEEEMEFYENYLWFEQFDKSSSTYKRILRKMKKLWN